MDYTYNERQRRHRKKLYKAGLKQIQLWVKKAEPKKVLKMNRAEFIRKFKRLTKNGWEPEELEQLYRLLIKLIRGQKEVNRLKKS